MSVADFGTGSGHYALALAKRVGPNGTVYAVDVQKEMLGHVREATKRAGVHNVKALWGIIDEIGGTKLADGVCEAVVISNVLFQTDDKLACAKEAFRILRSGGEVMVIDWSDNSELVGGGKAHLVPKTSAENFFTQAGFRITQSFEAGAHHWGFVAQKSK